MSENIQEHQLRSQRVRATRTCTHKSAQNEHLKETDRAQESGRRTNNREQTTRTQIQTCKAFKQDRWPGDGGRVMKYLKHNTLRPWSFRPASLSILRASSKDLVMVDELAAKTWVPF